MNELTKDELRELIRDEINRNYCCEFTGYDSTECRPVLRYIMERLDYLIEGLSGHIK